MSIAEADLEFEDTPPPVQVKDLLEFLGKLPPEMPVDLDNDGWLEDEIKYKTIQQLIKKRGLFQVEDGCLIINN